uniref:DUF3398 domain-containing protein n=1 Tax=Steinernema glaseri TaxID=37863 RepID=A0A1I8AC62_9BILA
SSSKACVSAFWIVAVSGRAQGSPPDGSVEKIYAAALHASDYDAYYDAVPLDSVDLKFITNFRVETVTPDEQQNLARCYKEITLHDLEKLVHFIRPVKNERHPLRYDDKSLNTLTLRQGSQWINRRIHSMRLPVDEVTLLDVKAGQFFETAGPLYYVKYDESDLEQRTVDALIEKFVPIDGGSFKLHQRLSEEHLRKLFEKCVLSKKKVKVGIFPKDSTKILDSTGPIDYDKYYSEREVIRQGEEVRFGNEDEEKLELQVRHQGEWVGWTCKTVSIWVLPEDSNGPIGYDKCYSENIERAKAFCIGSKEKEKLKVQVCQV